MHTFFQKPVRPLSMCRLTDTQAGAFRAEMVNLLACSSDPFSTALYQLDIGASRQCAQRIGTAAGTAVTLTPLIIKILAGAIAQNPVFNQIVFGGSIYQLEQIHIATLSHVPGTDGVTYIILDDPHQKSLVQIQQALFAGIESARAQAAAPPPGRLVRMLTSLCYRFGLFRLIGQRGAFTIGFTQGHLSNISLSVHNYAARPTFTMLKDVITPITIPVRIHVCGPVHKPCMENGMLVSKEILEVTLTADHRIVNGSHFFELGQSLEQITADPDTHLH